MFSNMSGWRRMRSMLSEGILVLWPLIALRDLRSPDVLGDPACLMRENLGNLPQVGSSEEDALQCPESCWSA